MSEEKNFSGGLGFHCNGLNHKGWVNKGWVKIQLRWTDTYTISFVNKKREVVKVVEGVYCDQLIEMLEFLEQG